MAPSYRYLGSYKLSTLQKWEGIQQRYGLWNHKIRWDDRDPCDPIPSWTHSATWQWNTSLNFIFAIPKLLNVSHWLNQHPPSGNPNPIVVNKIPWAVTSLRNPWWTCCCLIWGDVTYETSGAQSNFISQSFIETSGAFSPVGFGVLTFGEKIHQLWILANP